MRTSLNYTGQLDPIIALMIASIASLVIFLVYRMETRSLPKFARWLLPTLRSAAVLLIIFLLAGPVVETASRTGTMGQLTFLLDRSSSMRHVDGMPSKERIGRAKLMLEGDNGLIKSLQQTHDVSLVESASDALATDIAQLIFEGLPGEPSGGPNDTAQRTLVLISDGQNNTGDSPIESANEMNAAGATLSTWGFGLEEEPEEFSIIDVQHPQRINSTSRLRGKIIYKASGEANSKKILIKESGGKVLWQGPLSTSHSLDAEIEFEFPVEDIVEQLADLKKGQRQDVVRLNLRAEIEPSSMKEQQAANQSRQFSMLVVRADYKILILDGRSRWETRYLKNLFSRDPQWEANTVIFSELESRSFRPTAGQARIAPAELPNSLEQLLEYDLVIFGEVDPDNLNDRMRQWLPDYVARGGGLVLLDGQRDLIKRTLGENLMQLVPIRWLGEPKPFFADSIARTSTGYSMEWLSIGETEERSSQLWQKLPAPRAMRLVESAKDAEILVEADLGGHKYPLIVTRTFGGGRIVYFASDETWRWRYKVADEIYARFWNQLAIALVQPPLAIGNNFAELDADKAEYVASQRATIRVRLRNSDGSYNSDANVEAQLRREGELVESFLLRSDERLPGMYAGQSMPLVPGEYTVQFSANGYGETAAELTRSFSVVNPVSRESLRVSQNRELLERLAVAGGGEYFSENELDRMRAYLLPRTAGRIEITRLSLWDSYYWFVPVVLLLAVEWWLRKRLGLP